MVIVCSSFNFDRFLSTEFEGLKNTVDVLVFIWPFNLFLEILHRFFLVSCCIGFAYFC